jgi:hypothetical protein
LLPLPGLTATGWRPICRQRCARFDQRRLRDDRLTAAIQVPPFAAAFWGLVQLLAASVDVPLGLAQKGYAEFRFWR